MSKIFLMYLCLLCVSCKYRGSKSYKIEQTKTVTNQTLPLKYIGEFSVSTETEATTTGMASISYYFTIKKNEVTLKTNTYHEPIRCNGKYKIIDKDSLIELYYAGEELNCKSEYPDFKIKNNGKKYFIQGVGNEANSIEWVELNKKYK